MNTIRDSIGNLRLIVVSLSNNRDSIILCMNKLFSIMKLKPQSFNLWHLDDRRMSGDIERGATKESIAFVVQLAKAKERPLGFLQLAGRTNDHTVDGLKKERLFQSTSIANDETLAISSSNLSHAYALTGGIAYSGYARKV
ncbi:hypothetical protein TanjilG_15371 [Lupinus angustifolius]|uniref:Iron-sulphur binding protein LdpA C-terminal domain-containing protein n=1 Tax=Lupinus angustifolius TaxID=3871 RepID=A0A394DB31_LUPAN|nr:hypothetical protein TanjilG_15371 [Lupinus angustifolius]